MATLRLPARLESVRQFQAFVRHQVRDGGGRYLSGRIELALEEILVNVVRYAYEAGDGEMELSCEVADDGRLRVEVADWGRPFNPLTRRGLDPGQDLRSRPIGGWGIVLARQMADRVEYAYEDGKNIVKLEFTVF